MSSKRTGILGAHLRTDLVLYTIAAVTTPLFASLPTAPMRKSSASDSLFQFLLKKTCVHGYPQLKY